MAAIVLTLAVVPGTVADGVGPLSDDPAAAAWYLSGQLSDTPPTGETIGTDAGFGSAVDLEGDTAVIGVPSVGQSIVYERTEPGVWEQTARLEGDSLGDVFGWAVEIDEGTIAVGEPLASAVHLYEATGETGATWEKTATLSSDTARGFGAALALEGDRLIVGSPWTASTATVFERTGGDWLPAGDLAQPAAESFGHAVALDGRTAVVASIGSDQVFAYELEAGTWTLADVLEGDAEGAGFGFSVTVRQDTLVVGAPHEHALAGVVPGPGNSGAAYVYNWETESGTWSSVDKLVPQDVSPIVRNQHFGWSLALGDVGLVVGAAGDDRSPGLADAPLKQPLPCPSVPQTSQDLCHDPGAVYIYNASEEDASGLQQAAKLSPPDGGHADRFGSAVALDGAQLLVGSPGDDLAVDDAPGSDAGSVYAYRHLSLPGGLL